MAAGDESRERPGDEARRLPPAVTLVLGPEDVLVDRAVRLVVDAARASDPQTDVRHLVAAGLEPGVLTELLSPSLFGERRVVVVRNVHEAADELQAEIKRAVAAPDDDTHLVLVHTGGARGKALLDAARAAGATEVPAAKIRYDSDKLGFVRAEFQQAGRRITGEGAKALVDALGADLRELANACSQLVSDTAGTVDEHVVDRYYGGRVEATSFKVADATVEGRADEALGLLRHALATGVAPVLVTSALASGLRTLVKVGSASRGMRNADLAASLGLAPFMVDKARRQLPGWTGEGLAAAITEVARADADVKGAAADPVYALERAVVRIARSRGR